MIEIDVVLRREIDPATIPALIESACAAEGLTQTLLGTLKSHPGSMHWHWKSGRSAGTLEITWIADSRKLWLSVQAGRAAGWIEPAMARLKLRLESAG